MSKKNQQTVDSWTDATITTSASAKDKFEFPRHGLPLAQPAIVRKKPNGKAVVAASFRAQTGQATAIIASQSILGKLRCQPNDQIEYKTASFLNVLWATKVTLLLALLGCGVVIGPVFISVAALYPQSHVAIRTAWIVAVLTTLVAAVIAVISLRNAYKEPKG
jgi:hypothetical protein